MPDDTTGQSNPTIICLSHLAWDFSLFQRPQQLMTCFDQLGFSILYVGCIGKQARTSHQKTGRFGKQSMFINVDYSPFSPAIVRFLRNSKLLSQIRAIQPNERNTILWLTQPLLHSFSTTIHHSKLVFDAMDPYSDFIKSSPRLESILHQLCNNADLIFTGGDSMHQNLISRISTIRHKCFCFPSGINWEHFEKSTHEATPISSCLEGLSKPIWGYFGAIDERIDVSLIKDLCTANADGTVVLAGPILNKYFMQRHNLLPHNLVLTGPVLYTDLPSLLKGFDICLLPFKNNTLVSRLSPTKTPEYLAGRHPIVSTFIPDVKQTWGEFVNIGTTNKQIVELCHHARGISDMEYSKAKQCAQSWNDIAQKMVKLLQEKC